jgi:hypothetical protein
LGYWFVYGLLEIGKGKCGWAAKLGINIL